MTDANEKENARRKLDFEKKKHEIEEERKAMLQANTQTAKALYEKNPDNKGKEGFYASGLDKNVKLTAEQTQLIKTKLDTLNVEYENESKKRLQEDLQSLYDYLKEYGTIQEQRYAIAKEYDEKIQKATGDNQKKLLQKQKASALSQADARNMALNIDWGATFEGVGNVLGDIAKDVLSKVEAYMKTDEFKGLNAADKKTYTDLRQNLRKETTGGTSPFNLSAWKTIAQQVTEYQNSVKELKEASDAHTQALKNLERAENESLANDLLNERKKLEDIGLIQPTESSQSATGKAIEAITADQASTLIGIGYAMQSAMEQGNEMRKLISADIGYIRSSTETLSNNISEMRDAQYQGLQQLEAINKNTYNLFQIKDDIYELKKIAKDRW